MIFNSNCDNLFNNYSMTGYNNASLMSQYGSFNCMPSIFNMGSYYGMTGIGMGGCNTGCSLGQTVGLWLTSLAQSFMSPWLNILTPSPKNSQNQPENIRTTVKNLENKIETSNDKIKDWNKEKETESGKTSGLNVTLANANNKVTNLTTTITGLTTQRDAAFDEWKNASEEEKAAKKDAYDTIVTQLAEKNKELETAKKEQAEAQKAVDANQKKIDELDKKINAEQKNVNNLQGQKTEKQETLDDIVLDNADGTKFSRSFGRDENQLFGANNGVIAEKVKDSDCQKWLNLFRVETDPEKKLNYAKKFESLYNDYRGASKDLAKANEIVEKYLKDNETQV